VITKVRSGAELLRRAANNTEQLARIPTTLAPLDALIGGGLERGRLFELVSRRAAGRFSIALSALASSTSVGEAAALIDLGDHFDPRLAEANGIDLRRLLWVRPRTVKEAVMSAELIVATGFQLVVIDLGLHPIRGRRAPDAAWVRLARTAETSRTAMLVSTPYPVTGTASEAVIKGTSGRAKWRRGLLVGVEMSLTLEKHRHMKAGTREVVTLMVPEAENVVGSRLSVICAASVSGHVGQASACPGPEGHAGASRGREGQAEACPTLDPGIATTPHAPPAPRGESQTTDNRQPTTRRGAAP
jgi:hypothetical protein